MNSSFIQYILRELPLWFICTITSLMPDHPFFCRIRGVLAKSFFASCGRNFQFGSRVRFIRPGQINIGDDVYLAEGCWADGTSGLILNNEVLMGPYCVVVTDHHGRESGSYRFARGKSAPVTIGRGTWLGAHVVVAAGSYIGEGCLIGANVTVSGCIPDNRMVRYDKPNITPVH